jgi:hypothetical protein
MYFVEVQMDHDGWEFWDNWQILANAIIDCRMTASMRGWNVRVVQYAVGSLINPFVLHQCYQNISRSYINGEKCNWKQDGF